MMADSGARGSPHQMKQLAGMRGLMPSPGGRIMENPVKANFREGMSVLEFFVSTHGQRKGLTDTALKTANGGYMTRRLVDVTQDLVIAEEDCGVVESDLPEAEQKGIHMRAVLMGGEEVVRLRDRIFGRYTAADVRHPQSAEILYPAGTYIDSNIADEIERKGRGRGAGAQSGDLRGEARDLREMLRAGPGPRPDGADGRGGGGGRRPVDRRAGNAADSADFSPGPRLPARRFGGAGAQRGAGGRREFAPCHPQDPGGRRAGGGFARRRAGVARFRGAGARAPPGAVWGRAEVLRRLPAEVKPGKALLERDPLVHPEVAEYEGTVKFENIAVGDNARELLDETTGLTSLEIVASKRAVTEAKRKSRGKSEEKRPQVKFLNSKGEEVQTGAGSPVVVKLRPGHRLEVSDGQKISIGDTVANMPKEDVVKSGDITGGLPRVVELFEAREPKEPAILAKAKGVVTLEEPVRNKQQVVIRDAESGETEVQLVPKGRAVLVQTGSVVERGEEIVEGAVNPHAILREQGVEKLTDHIVAHVQEVYRLQGVTINDKHIEVIVRQMLRNVEIEDTGDSHFVEGDHASRAEVLRVNEKLRAEGKSEAKYRRILLGITKASLATDSFFSAASFQETTKVITEASLAGRSDHLRGLKENVIIGRLIPAGTGFIHYREQELGEKIELQDLMVQEGMGDSEPEETRKLRKPPKRPPPPPPRRLRAGGIWRD